MKENTLYTKETSLYTGIVGPIVPEYSDWRCYLFGSHDGYGLCYTPRKGDVPNWFVRQMSNLLLGCKWRKIKK